MNETKFEYKEALKTDIEYLLWLRKVTMNEHLCRLEMNVSDTSHINRIMFEFNNAKIILLNNQRIGLLKVKENENNIEIIQIQIEPIIQGKGIGQEIIKSIIKKADQRNLSVKLSVLKGNKVIKLYESLGFKIIEENNNSYLMKKCCVSANEKDN